MPSNSSNKQKIAKFTLSLYKLHCITHNEQYSVYNRHMTFNNNGNLHITHLGIEHPSREAVAPNISICLIAPTVYCGIVLLQVYKCTVPQYLTGAQYCIGLLISYFVNFNICTSLHFSTIYMAYVGILTLITAIPSNFGNKGKKNGAEILKYQRAEIINLSASCIT